MLGSMMKPLKKPAGYGHREMLKQKAQEAQATNAHHEAP